MIEFIKNRVEARLWKHAYAYFLFKHYNFNKLYDQINKWKSLSFAGKLDDKQKDGKLDIMIKCVTFNAKLLIAQISTSYSPTKLNKPNNLTN